jgi:hypothetical protein
MITVPNTAATTNTTGNGPVPMTAHADHRSAGRGDGDHPDSRVEDVDHTVAATPDEHDDGGARSQQAHLGAQHHRRHGGRGNANALDGGRMRGDEPEQVAGAHLGDLANDQPSRVDRQRAAAGQLDNGERSSVVDCHRRSPLINPT